VRVIVTIDTGLVNVFLLVERRVVIVDTGYGGSEQTVLAALAEHGITSADVALLVVTHGHVDHFGAAAALRERLGVPVLVHRHDADCLREGRNAPMRMAAQVSEPARRVFLDKVQRMRVRPLEPDIVVDSAFDLDAFGVCARLLPTPGHSPGSLSVALDGGEIIIADLVTETRVAPKRVTLPLFFDDLTEVRSSLEAVLSLGPRSLLASHGRAFAPEEVRALLTSTPPDERWSYANDLFFPEAQP
jgi:glyoxylase-like metal-dependent hydrolase (beta-lactamase superfamily II)